MTKQIGIVLGESIGEIEEVEMRDQAVAWGKCLQIRVRVDVSKPLKRSAQLTSANGDSIWDFFYMKNCQTTAIYVCGCLDHLESDCPLSLQSKVEGIKQAG